MTAPPALSRRRRKARLLRSYLRGRPVWASWQVTRRCGSFCHFCEHRAEGAFDELDTAGCERVADALGSLSLVVSLTGGDPFLRDDLPLVVRRLARSHFPVLTTHGWLVTRERAQALWEAGLEAATVTLEDARPERHDARVGLPGAHARALLAVEAFAGTRTRRGQVVTIKARLHETTPEQVDRLGDLAARTPARLALEPPFPVARGQAVAPGFSEALRALRRRARLGSSAGYLGRLEAALDGGIAGCRAGRSFFNVDHRGRVSRCIEFQRPEDAVGSLLDAPSGDLLRRLRVAAAGHGCRACYQASRGEVEAVYSPRGLLRALGDLVGR